MGRAITIIRKCSECSGLISEHTTTSNTISFFEATIWTDGKAEVPRHSDQPWLVKCPYCQALIWLDEQEYVCNSWSSSYENISDDLISYDTPTLEEYSALLGQNALDHKKEKYLRLLLWWDGNDQRRESETKHDLSEEEKKNIQALAEILNPSDDNDRIMLAEIKRELGLFEEAVVLLEGPFKNKLPKAVSIIQELVQKKILFVSVLFYPRSKLSDEKKCLMAVRKGGKALQRVPEKFKTQEICRVAVKDYGPALEYIPESLKTKALCRVAVKNHGSALKFVPETHKSLAICRVAVEMSSGTLKHVPLSLRTEALCRVSVEKNGGTLKHVPESLRTEELCNLAVEKSGGTLKHVPESLRTEELCKLAVKNDGNALKYVPKEFKNNILEK